MFVGPEVSQFVKLGGPSEAPATLESLGFAAKSLALFAVNSQRDPSRAGGSHWSLLVYSRRNTAFYHLDSAQGANESEARALAAAVTTGDKPVTFHELEETASRQQDNSYDCGVFLLANAENMARHFATTNGVDSLIAVKWDTVAGFRQHMHQLIPTLSNKQS